MQTRVTPEQRQAARCEMVRQVEQGASAKVARVSSAVAMHRTTAYRLRVSRAERRRKGVDRPTAWSPSQAAWGSPHGSTRTLPDHPLRRQSCAATEARKSAWDCASALVNGSRVRASLGLSRKLLSREKKAQKRLVD